MPHPSHVIVIAGPTGSGKTAAAVQLARRIDGEIVNFDSIQLYKGYDIGSAKPSATERAVVPHHLLDHIEATTEYTAADYQRDADIVCREIIARGRTAILAGGTFFYLRAFLTGLPEIPPRNAAIRERLDAISRKPRGLERLRRLLRRVDEATAVRIPGGDWHRTQRALEVYLVSGRPISSWQRPLPSTARRVAAVIFALNVPRDVLVGRLNRRVDAMYANGLIEETALLLSRYPSAARPFEAIGYREAARHIRGELALDEAIAETKRRTRAYAKRQMTWLRGEQNIGWIDGETTVEQIVEQILRTIRIGDTA